MTPILHSGPGIIIGIPTLGRPVPLDWALAFKSMNPPTNYNCIFQLIKGQEVAAARNAIAQFAIEKKAKYLFFLGDDVVCPSHTLRQLIFRMEQDENIGVVGGVYVCKADPPDPLVYRGNGRGSYWDWKIGEFFEVTGLGLDCNLLRVSMLEKLWANGPELFKTVDEDEFLDGRQNAEAWTEDLYFYKRVLDETKFRIFCDASIICEHHDVYGGKVYKLPADSLPMRQKITTKYKKLLMIGRPVDLADGERDQFDVVRFGESEFSDYRGQTGSLPFADNEFDWTIITLDEIPQTLWFKEWIRVSKTKLSLRLNKHLAILPIEEYLKAYGEVQLNGDWLEIQIPALVEA